MNLGERYQYLLTCPQLIDTRDHLPYFASFEGSTVLEIGCDVGNSTAAFLYGTATHVTSIDINPACAENFPGCDRWWFILGNSRDESTIQKVMACTFDVLFIDGDHSYEGASADLVNYSRLVRPGGLILMHDVLCPDTFPGVRRAFDEFPQSNKWIREGSYGLGVIQV